jgi:hypothetical protein
MSNILKPSLVSSQEVVSSRELMPIPATMPLNFVLEKTNKKNSMKRDKIVYWITTGTVAAMMFLSAYMYLTHNPELVSGFKALGFPLYFVTILGVAKLLGAIVLVAPAGRILKEWAYAGFIFIFIGATWTHLVTRTPFIMPLILLGILGVSYWFWTRVVRSAINR